MRTRRRWRIGILLLVAALCAGCAFAPVPPAPPREAPAERSDN